MDHQEQIDRAEHEYWDKYQREEQESESTIYSVSCLATEDDNGFCVSFTSKQERDDCAAQMRREGCYHVREWES
jgi:hypothetical protein